MILLKCLVLSPVDEVCVLDRDWMSVTKEEKTQQDKKDVRQQANNEAHPVVYVVASFALKALNRTPFSGHRL